MTFIRAPLLHVGALPLVASLRMQTPLWISQAPLSASYALLFRM